jgi:hypothetical protein
LQEGGRIRSTEARGLSGESTELFGIWATGVAGVKHGHVEPAVMAVLEGTVVVDLLEADEVFSHVLVGPGTVSRHRGDLIPVGIIGVHRKACIASVLLKLLRSFHLQPLCMAQPPRVPARG